MIKQYLSQAWRILKENPILSAISILGTALAICMIMVIVMTYEIKNAPMAPEVNRDRMLYIKFVRSQEKDDKDFQTNGALGMKLIKEAILPVKSAEAISIITSIFQSTLTTRAGSNIINSYDAKCTNADFWKVFQFDFIAGQPFKESDVNSHLKKAVISEKVARETFGSTNVIGQEILFNYTSFEVVGIVKDVSTLMTTCYSQIWVPIESLFSIPDYMEGASGPYKVALLAKKKSDFQKIKAELASLLKKFNADPNPVEVSYRGQPDTHFIQTIRKYSDINPDIKGTVQKYLLIGLIIMLIPAINLFEMCQSQINKRLSELGIRRAFGARKDNIFSQLLLQGLLQTVIGAIIGLCLAILSAYIFRDFILGSGKLRQLSGNMSIDIRQVLRPLTFLAALFFCLLLNILSSILPYHRVTKHDIIKSIHQKQ